MHQTQAAPPEADLRHQKSGCTCRLLSERAGYEKTHREPEMGSCPHCPTADEGFV